MIERAALDSDLRDLGILTRASQANFQRTPAVPSSIEGEIERPHDFGEVLLPEVLRELEQPAGALIGNPAGSFSLQDAVKSGIRALETEPRSAGMLKLTTNSGQVLLSDLRACIERSLGLFAMACERQGVELVRLTLGPAGKVRSYPVPRIRRRTRQGTRDVNPYRFLYLWFSSVTYKKWTDNTLFPRLFRGAGAPGALRYAGLMRGDDYVRSTKDDVMAALWPGGLEPGSLLQVWKNEETYLAVQAGTPGFGHSCIFQDYGRLSDGHFDRKVIIVADQIGLRHHLICGETWKVRYLIGANLKRADVE
jgi:hypothetical protein